MVAVHSLVGQFGPVAIPGRSVGFDAAAAYLWLRPDYFAVAHAHLPVLLMLSGWPGDVKDWARAGEVIKLADHWAATHEGAAPVMVFVDENGARGYDTECVNGPQGNSETYLTRTVPNYVTHTLGIKDDPERWAVVGFSEGGTCAVDLGTMHSHLYGRFVDVAGDVVGVRLSPERGAQLRFRPDVAYHRHRSLWRERGRLPGPQPPRSDGHPPLSPGGGLVCRWYRRPGPPQGGGKVGGGRQGRRDQDPYALRRRWPQLDLRRACLRPDLPGTGP